MGAEDQVRHPDGPTPKKQLLLGGPAEQDMVDQYFEETLNADVP